MFERFTDRARKVMAFAHQEAERLNHEYMSTEHILLGLVKEGSGVAANVLKTLDIDLRKVRLEVEKMLTPGSTRLSVGKLLQTPRVKQALQYAIEEARCFKHNYVGTEHLLLGLLREKEGVAAEVLAAFGLKVEKAREEILNMIGAGVTGESSENSPSSIPFDPSVYTQSSYTQSALRVIRNGAWAVEARSMILPVGTGHILIALLQEEGSQAAAILRKAGLTPEAVREEIRKLNEP